MDSLEPFLLFTEKADFVERYVAPELKLAPEYSVELSEVVVFFASSFVVSIIF